MKTSYLFQKLSIFIFFTCIMILFQNCGQNFDGASDVELEALNSIDGEASEVSSSLALNTGLPTPILVERIQTSVGVRLFYEVGPEIEKINVEINDRYFTTKSVVAGDESIFNKSIFIGNNHFQRGRNKVKIIGIRGQERSLPSNVLAFDLSVPAGPGNILPQQAELVVGNSPEAGSSLAGIPRGVQYVQLGFTSSVLMYNGLRGCRVPDRFFKNVEQNSSFHSRLENFINNNNSAGTAQFCADRDFQ